MSMREALNGALGRKANNSRADEDAVSKWINENQAKSDSTSSRKESRRAEAVFNSRRACNSEDEGGSTSKRSRNNTVSDATKPEQADCKDFGTSTKVKDSYVDSGLGQDDSPIGLAVWIDPIHAAVGIVAIHGLNGHRDKTWTAKNHVNWLRDLNMLPASIPNARIMSWGYDANTHSTEELSTKSLHDHAETLVSDLSLLRETSKTNKRPIIFVAHSLGGLVLKSALIHSNSTRFDHLFHHRAIKTSTYGIMFMGTPHQGGEGVSWGKRFASVASIFIHTNQTLLKVLERDSEILQQQLSQYCSISGDFETKFAYETKATPLPLGKTTMVVPKPSAVVPGQVNAEPIAIHGDHNSMVKFATQNNEFRKVAGHLKLMVERAVSKVHVQKTGGPEIDREPSLATAQVPESATDRRETSAPFDVVFDLAGVPSAKVFIGRKADLDLLETKLMPGKKHDRRKICVIHGLGGIGKTQLAIEFARLHQSQYTSIFWIDGKTESSLIQSLLRIQIRLPGESKANMNPRKPKSLKESRKAAQDILKWFMLRENTKWLLVFDNIDRACCEENLDQEVRSSSYSITQYFPAGDKGSIIMTARRRSLASLGTSLHLRKLDPLDCLQLLESYAELDLRRKSQKLIEGHVSKFAAWDRAAIDLVERLDGLPLALVVASSHISTSSIDQYLDACDNSWQRLHEQSKWRADYPGRAITTTWQTSVNEIERIDKTAAKLLRLWGYFSNREIWYELLQPWNEVVKSTKIPDWLRKISKNATGFSQTLGTLVEFSLVEWDEKSSTYSMNTVVHDWVKASIDVKKDKRLLQTAICTLGLTPPRIKDCPAIQQRLLPHVCQCMQHFRPDSVDIDYIKPELYLLYLDHFARLCVDLGLPVDGEIMYRCALQGHDKLDKRLGTEREHSYNAAHDLALLLYDQGNLVDAERMYLRALRGKKRLLGRKNESTLTTVHKLGKVYKQQNELDKAETMYQWALQGRTELLGAEDDSTLDTFRRLADIYTEQGNYAFAEEMEQRYLRICERLYGREHRETLRIVHTLGYIQKSQGMLDMAEELYQRALRGREKILGPEHDLTLETCGALGDLYLEQDRLAEAECMYLRKIEGREKAFGKENQYTENTFRKLAAVYVLAGMQSGAEACLRSAQRSHEKAV